MRTAAWVTCAALSRCVPRFCIGLAHLRRLSTALPRPTLNCRARRPAQSPFGTVDNPVLVPSDNKQRIVGCTGGVEGVRCISPRPRACRGPRAGAPPQAGQIAGLRRAGAAPRLDARRGAAAAPLGGARAWHLTAPAPFPRRPPPTTTSCGSSSRRTRFSPAQSACRPSSWWSPRSGRRPSRTSSSGRMSRRPPPARDTAQPHGAGLAGSGPAACGASPPDPTFLLPRSADRPPPHSTAAGAA